MTTTNPIAAYLKTYHKGAERVVSSRELEAAFQIRGPDLRRLINSLRGDGVPICSSASGAGSRRSPTRNAVSPRRWSNPSTADRYPFRWRAVIPLEKLHPLGGR